MKKYIALPILTLLFVHTTFAQTIVDRDPEIEGMVKEIESEMEYLRRREERFSSTNGEISCRMLECTVRFRVHLRKDSEQTRVD